MTDLRKKSGICYLAIFLFLVCAAAAGVMTFTAVWTADPIRARQEAAIHDALKQVLPAFETVTTEEVVSSDGIASVFYTARDEKNKIVGYAVRTCTMQGYGGEVEALIGFKKSGRILKIVVTGHNETPGLGSKVMDRKAVRRLKDVFSKEEAEAGLPPNEALDSYAGRSVWEKSEAGDGNVAFVTSASKKSKSYQVTPHAIRRNEVHFVSGATVSSLAMLDLVNRAGEILRAKTTTEGEAK